MLTVILSAGALSMRKTGPPTANQRPCWPRREHQAATGGRLGHWLARRRRALVQGLSELPDTPLVSCHHLSQSCCTPANMTTPCSGMYCHPESIFVQRLTGVPTATATMQAQPCQIPPYSSAQERRIAFTPAQQPTIPTTRPPARAHHRQLARHSTFHHTPSEHPTTPRPPSARQNAPIASSRHVATRGARTAKTRRIDVPRPGARRATQAAAQTCMRMADTLQGRHARSGEVGRRAHVGAAGARRRVVRRAGVARPPRGAVHSSARANGMPWRLCAPSSNSSKNRRGAAPPSHAAASLPPPEPRAATHRAPQPPHRSRRTRRVAPPPPRRPRAPGRRRRARQPRFVERRCGRRPPAEFVRARSGRRTRPRAVRVHAAAPGVDLREAARSTARCRRPRQRRAPGARRGRLERSSAHRIARKDSKATHPRIPLPYTHALCALSAVHPPSPTACAVA